MYKIGDQINLKPSQSFEFIAVTNNFYFYFVGLSWYLCILTNPITGVHMHSAKNELSNIYR